MVIVSIHFHLVPLFLKNRIFEKNPERGDIIVFKTPSDNRTDYIKRLIGLPGDVIQFINGNLYINNNQVLSTLISNSEKLYCGPHEINVSTFEEKLSENKSYIVSYRNDVSFQNSDKYIVPNNHYFFWVIIEIVQKIVDFYLKLDMSIVII